MYVIHVNTGKSIWIYGPYNSYSEAKHVAESHKLLNFTIIQSIPLEAN